MYPILSAVLNGLIFAIFLTAAVWLALRLTPRHTINAATRYVIWWVMLGAALLIPLSFLPFPHRRVGLRGHSEVSMPFIPVTATTVIPVGAAPGRIPIYVSDPARPWPTWPLLLWPLLSLALLTRLGTGYFHLNRIKARARVIPAPRIDEWLNGCRGARPGIILAISPEIFTPVAAGPNRPAILIPARLFDELSLEDLDRIGLHETAHLVRRDDYALLFQRIVEALFMAWPLIFWIGRRIELEREIACDDLVIAASGHARSYAHCLTRIVESVDGRESAWPAATAAEGVSQLARRVDALLDKTRRAGADLMKGRLAAVAALLLALAFIAVRSPALVAFVASRVAPVHRIVPARPLAAQTQRAEPESGALAGQVVDDNSGKPVAAAELRFRRPGGRELAADLETDRQGRFSAAGLPAAQYTVEVVKPNFAGTTFQLTVPSASLMVRLIHYGVIDGQAINSAGQPMPSIIRAPGGRTVGSSRVTVLTKDPVSGRLGTFRETSLEDGGHYRIYDLPPGQYAVGFWYSGQNEGSGVQLYPDNTNPRFFSVAGGEEYDHVDFTIVPRPAAQISGRLQMPEGVTGQFQMALGLPEQPNLPIAQTLSEKDGSFRFEKIPPGTYDLFAAGPVGGYGQFDSILDGKGDSFFGRARVPSAGQDVENLSVALAPGKSMRVMVRAHGNGPLPAGCPATVKLTVIPLEPWAILFHGDTEIAFGKEQTIPKLAPGLFHVAPLELGKTCFQTNDSVADLRGELTEPVSIELSGAGAIHGLLHGGAPGSVVALTSSNPADSMPRRVAFADAAGRFAFEALPPGPYTIAGKKIDVASGFPTEVEVNQ